MYYSLNELFPGASYREWITSAVPGWSAFNPSISFSPVEGYKAIIRSSNYLMDEEGYYHMTSPEGVIRTQNHLATLDSDLNIVALDLIRGDWGEVKFPLVVGLEDARLQWAHDHWFIYGTLRQHRSDGLCEVATAGLEGDQMVRQCVMNNPEPGRHQKNWMAMSGTADFIYTVSPPQVMNGAKGLYLLKRTHTEPFSPECEQFRGSSQAIETDYGYLAVTHEVDWSTGRRRYYHRFVAFDDAGYCFAYTEPFSIIEPAIEFVAGLVEHQEDYVISFGYKDERAFLARIPKVEVDKSLLDAY